MQNLGLNLSTGSKIDKHLSSKAAEMPVKLYNDTNIVPSNLTASDDDVMKWKYMLTLCEGKPPVTWVGGG